MLTIEFVVFFIFLAHGSVISIIAEWEKNVDEAKSLPAWVRVGADGTHWISAKRLLCCDDMARKPMRD